MSSKLPDTLYGLIDLTLVDIEWCEQHGGYEFQTATWHVPFKSGLSKKCAVCAGGAVMAHTLGSDITLVKWSSDFDIYTHIRLEVIDELREGCVNEASFRLYGNYVTIAQDRVICPYLVDRDQFFHDMRQLADELRLEGV